MVAAVFTAATIDCHFMIPLDVSHSKGSYMIAPDK
jgi:hypothetical protein